MMTQIEPTVTYCRRAAVVDQLFGLMRATLSRRDYQIILARCGYTGGGPQPFTAIAAQFGLDNAAHASLCYRHAVGEVRRAIPGSPLAAYLRGYPDAWGE